MQTLKKTVTVVAVATALVPLSASVARAQDPNALGRQSGREYVSNAPFELIDPVSGNLILQFTDLELPGNAGGGLRFQRTYNTKSGMWNFGLAGMVMRIGDDWPSYPGCYLLPTLYGADGSVPPTMLLLQTYPNGGGCPSETWRWVTTDRFGKYDRATHQLTLPDGSVSEYTGWNGTLSSYRDAFGNQVTLTGWGSNTLTVTQTLGTSEQRVVTLELDTTNCYAPWGSYAYATSFCNLPASITYGGRTFTYGWYPSATATSPAGTWQLSSQFIGSTREDILTTPNGGTIRYRVEPRDYGWECDEDYNCWPLSTTVMTNRKVFDRDATLLGEWSYAYTLGDGFSSATARRRRPSSATRRRDDRTPSATGWSDGRSHLES